VIEVHKKVKAVVFDLDGTLIDSAKQVLHIINFIRKKYLKKKKLSSNNVYRFLSIGGSKLIKQSLSLRKNEEIYLKIFRKIYLKKKFNIKIIYPNVLNFFKKLKKKKN
jgi:phosphoglycolate phosphatase-like HAD superfamily hydrolase